MSMRPQAEVQVRFRQALAGVPIYKPGRPPSVSDSVVPVKMSSNENPFPPLPGVLEAVAQAATQLNRYPDMSMTALREAIGAHDGVTADEVVVGTGSSGVLSALAVATCEAGDEVVYAWRSFEAYPIVVGLTGASSVQVPLDADGRHDLEAMAAAITPATRLVLVCSPNNPTGTVVHEAELEAFLAKVPQDVLVVLDEAYLEFVRDSESPSGIEVFRRHSNLVLLRTFSKAYGLAGLRVGYAIAHPAVAEMVRACILPFPVSDMAMAAVFASLEAEGALAERVETVVAERDRMRTALLDLGYDVPESGANFVWLPLGEDTVDFATAADAVGLSVRPFPGDGVRVSVAEADGNDRFLTVAQEFAARRR